MLKSIALRKRKLKSSFVYLLTPLLLVIGLSACSNKPELNATPLFHSQITQDNGKLFKFYLLMHRGDDAPNEQGNRMAKSAKPEKGNKPKKEGGRSGRGKGKDNGPSTDAGSKEEMAMQAKNKQQLRLAELLQKALEQEIEDNGYCRRGYRTFEEKITRGMLSIKGECYDSATAQDKKRFVSRDLS